MCTFYVRLIYVRKLYIEAAHSAFMGEVKRVRIHCTLNEVDIVHFMYGLMYGVRILFIRSLLIRVNQSFCTVNVRFVSAQCTAYIVSR